MSFDNLVKAKRRGKTRTIEMNVSQQNIDDQVSAFLYSIGVVHDNEEIVSLDYGQLGSVRPLKIEIYKKSEVKRPKTNGQSKESAGLS